MLGVLFVAWILLLFIRLFRKVLTRVGGGSRIFFRRGCTCLLLYFNTNKPHSFFCAEYQLY